jgi:hypothetical protein
VWLCSTRRHRLVRDPGEHPAIVETSLWDQVQAVLAMNRVKRATGAHAKQPSLLGGMVFDETGQRLTPIAIPLFSASATICHSK